MLLRRDKNRCARKKKHQILANRAATRQRVRGLRFGPLEDCAPARRRTTCAHRMFPGAQHAVGPNPTSVALADVNGDGRLDIVTANFTGDNVSVLLGQADGTFAAQATCAVGGTPESVALRNTP